MLLISWFANETKWDNMPLITFYPQGLNYFRPFRYRHEWISQHVLGELEKSSAEFITSSIADTLLCAKFSSVKSVLPLRKVELTHVQASADEYYVYFRFGPLVDYRQCASILHYSGELTESINDEDSQKLIHRNDYDLGKIDFVPEQAHQAEDSSWAKLLDLMCRDQELPLENVRRSFFLRLSGLIDRNTGKTLIPSKVGTSLRKGDFYGYALKEDKYYEAEILHRAPLLIGTRARLEVFNYKTWSPGDYLGVSPDHLEMSGNYESHVIQIYTKESSPKGQTLHFECPDTKTATFDGDTLNLHNFQLYYKNTFSFTKWLRKWVVPVFIIFALLFVALILRDFEEKGWGAFCSITVIGETILLLIMAVIGGVAFWKRP